MIPSTGWSLLDNVIIRNGTLYIVTEDPSSFLDPYHMFSTGAPMLSDPASWAAKDPTSKEIRIVTPAEALRIIGPHASRLEGVTFLCNDNPQFVSHYYHFVAEILFGLWRTYSVLDLNIQADGNTTLAAPRRFLFPRVKKLEFDDYSGLSSLIPQTIFPTMSFEFSDTWADRSQTDRPFIFDRVVIADRVSAEHAPEWNGLYKYVAPAFTLPGSPGPLWWSPVRRALLQFLGKFRAMESPTASTVPVITYISRQDWNRRMLHPDDHKVLVKALGDLHRNHGYEVNIVNVEELSEREQLSLAVRTTVMLGVHGNGLTHAVWMDPRRKPVLMEFFAQDGFSTDYEYPMRQLGIEYYGWWGNKYFGHRELPSVYMGGGFQGNNIRIDGMAVAAKIVEHIQSSETS
ncbi:uncharacterized protein EI90DRAFT_2902602 [Cantharellus anzutake]|uniref:uncharacterized protein n=1 Tax=Cantharellus anzutake TaxID=1750568 RepID=UPI001904BF1F|nr:uncharacterized protein EI90DRAFT_2902602 [Cantharellus anzutake]KAF8342741.1 hypothetical protein EI90DRAFT_2902602 [Cantharellus anzutake]